MRQRIKEDSAVSKVFDWSSLLYEIWKYFNHSKMSARARKNTIRFRPPFYVEEHPVVGRVASTQSGAIVEWEHRSTWIPYVTTCSCAAPWCGPNSSGIVQWLVHQQLWRSSDQFSGLYWVLSHSNLVCIDIALESAFFSFLVNFLLYSHLILFGSILMSPLSRSLMLRKQLATSKLSLGAACFAYWSKNRLCNQWRFGKKEEVKRPMRNSRAAGCHPALVWPISKWLRLLAGLFLEPQLVKIDRAPNSCLSNLTFFFLVVHLTFSYLQISV